MPWRTCGETVASAPLLYRNLPKVQCISTPLISYPSSLSSDLRTRLVHFTPTQRSRLALESVRETVAKALGFSSPEQVDVNRPLRDIGIDSLIAVLVRNKLANLTDLALGARVVFKTSHSKI